MQRAKAFFFVCLGILALAVAYHFGATTATAQAPGNPIVSLAYGSSAFGAVAANGDFYVRAPGGPWVLYDNVFGGSAPTPAQRESWGAVKQRYR